MSGKPGEWKDARRPTGWNTKMPKDSIIGCTVPRTEPSIAIWASTSSLLKKGDRLLVIGTAEHRFGEFTELCQTGLIDVPMQAVAV